MKKIYLSIIALFFIGAAFAQIENPVKWTFTAKKVSAKEYDVYMTATLDNSWHIYAQDAGEGPEPTSFSFTKNPLISLDGKVKEVGKLEKEYDKNFGSTLKFYANKVTFVQRVKAKTAAPTVLKGTVNYMVCNDRKCLPPKDVDFSVKL